VSLYIFGPWLTGEPLSDWLGVVGGGGVSATDTVPTQYEGFGAIRGAYLESTLGLPDETEPCGGGGFNL
jgi:hypothetical protein